MQAKPAVVALSALVALAAGVAGCGGALPSGLQARPHASLAARDIPGQTLVKLAPGASVQAYARKHGMKHVQAIGLGIHLFEGKAGAEALGRDPEVRWAEPNRTFSLEARTTVAAAAPVASIRPLSWPNDPLLPGQWGVEKIGTLKVWPTQQGRPDVVVAVIDSGIDASHPEFEGQLVPGYDFIAKPPAPGGNRDRYGHGTHIAGVIAARTHNGLGVAGIAPACKLMPVKIFNDWGHSTEGAAAAAVIWAVDNGAKVINASWGSPLPGQAAMDAYQYALDKDVVLVAAVGNSGSNETKTYPGAFDGAIGVSASTDIDGWASFSTWGDWVDVAAPGKGILSTFPVSEGNGYRVWEGTSMAAPYVSAAAALVRSHFPGMTQEQVKQRLYSTAKDNVQQGVDPYSGHGRVDVARAVLDPM